jgi:hypothetical protein
VNEWAEKGENCLGSVYYLAVCENPLSEMKVDLGNSCTTVTDKDLYSLAQWVNFSLNVDSD